MPDTDHEAIETDDQVVGTELPEDQTALLAEAHARFTDYARDQVKLLLALGVQPDTAGDVILEMFSAALADFGDEKLSADEMADIARVYGAATGQAIAELAEEEVIHVQ
jgi:hypothetical protein